MGKVTQKLKKLSGFVYAFVALAIVFLAVGLGTLGSFDTARGRIKKARGRRIPVPVRCYLNTSMPFSCSSYILPYQRLMK